jgi:hypothetical protein
MSLFEILYSSFLLELPSLFVFVESSDPVESCLLKKTSMSSLFALKKIVLSPGVVLHSSSLLVSWCVFLCFCISSCLLYPLLLSYTSCPPNFLEKAAVRDHGVVWRLPAVFLLGGEVIVICVLFLVAGAGMYLTDGGLYAGGWDCLSVLSYGIRVKQV